MTCSPRTRRHSDYRMRGSPLQRLRCDVLVLVRCIVPLRR